MFYIVDEQTKEIIRTSETPSNKDESIQPEGEVIQLKRVIDETKPAFDAATQKLVQVFVDDENSFTRTFKFEVAQLSADELAAKQQMTQDADRRAQIKAVYTALQNGTGTAAERLTRLEKAVAFLLRYEVR